MLHTTCCMQCSAESIELESGSAAESAAGTIITIITFELCIHCISISANKVINKKRKETSNKNILTKMEQI